MSRGYKPLLQALVVVGSRDSEIPPTNIGVFPLDVGVRSLNNLSD